MRLGCQPLADNWSEQHQSVEKSRAILIPRSIGSSAWMICTLFLLTFTTAAVPASADVLISVNKSTQQMSVAVDRVPRYRFAVSTGRAGYGTPNGTYIRNVWQPHGFRSCTTIRQCRIRSFSTVVMQFMAAMRSTGLADRPHMAASVCILQTPQLFSNW